MTHMATYTKEIENLNNQIIYINRIVEICLFLLVSLPLGLVTGGLSGSPRSTFWFLQFCQEIYCVPL